MIGSVEPGSRSALRCCGTGISAGVPLIGPGRAVGQVVRFRRVGGASGKLRVVGGAFAVEDR
ncbi:hypothetical protein CU254_16185 [Amycolatopsis sp. AA4]|nr:hypothetical protein CU254_16185 [Amycolatopsis sp. AA4]